MRTQVLSVDPARYYWGPHGYPVQVRSGPLSQDPHRSILLCSLEHPQFLDLAH